MPIVAAYPGTFSPPTWGHFRLLEQAARIFDEVRVICSVNPDKSGLLFSPEDAVRLWHGYPLPENIRVETLNAFMAAMHPRGDILLVRGIRDEHDAEYEKGVMLYNRKEFGIGQFLFLMADPKYHDISSTRARKAAEELRLEEFPSLVAPTVVSTLLEHALGVKNVILVIGPAGGGKSTLMRALTDVDPLNVHVDTDRFLDDTKDAIRAKFGADPVTVALTRNEELTAFLAPLWFDRLRDALRCAPKRANLFIEVPYALQPDKMLHRNIGGKVLYVHCGDRAENERRVVARGTPQHVKFLDAIPSLGASGLIATVECLSFAEVVTGGSLNDLPVTAGRVHDGIADGSLWHASSDR